MKLTTKLIKLYNHSDTLLVISTYPQKNTTHTGGGLASYTKNTLKAIKHANPTKKIVVLANIIQAPQAYRENDILVIRCWQHNSPLLYPQILKQVSHFNHVKDILIEFEFAAYGDFWTTSFFPLLMNWLKLNGKNLTNVVHQVLPNIRPLAKHVGLSQSPLKLKLYNYLLSIFYRLLVKAPNQVITLEKNLAQKLTRLTSSTQISYLSHGLYLPQNCSKNISRKKLKLDPKTIYVLAFGYLSHYKGSDLLVKAFSKPLNIKGKPVKLILAGGINPTQGQKPHYLKFYSQLNRLTSQNPNIVTTNFVPEEQIADYFSAADLVVFPYRTSMSASGPVSLAIAHQKPLLVSSPLRHYSPLQTKLNSQSIRKNIQKAISSHQLLDQSRQYSHQLAQERNFSLQGDKYLDIVTTNKAFLTSSKPTFSPAFTQ